MAKRGFRAACGAAAAAVCIGLLLVPGVHALPEPGSAPPAAWPVTPLSLDPPTDLGPLDGDHPLLTFAGGVTNPTPFPLVNVPVTPVCAVTCQEFTFTATSATPFLVSVKDTAASLSSGWDLYLYGPNGLALAGANGVGANGQAVEIDAPLPGQYTIVVTYTYAEDPAAAYTGEVRALTAPVWNPPSATCDVTVGAVTGCFLLPELRAIPASDLHVSGLPPVASTPLGFPLPVDVPTASSCYLDEALLNPGQRCLRFTSDVVNVGAGTLTIGVPWLATQPSPASGFLPGGCQAQQVIHTTAGEVASRPAGDCEFHPAHAHFHYRDLVSFTLYALDGNGGVGAPAASSLKESFCLADDDYFGFGTSGPNGPRNYVGQPDCNLPAHVDPTAITVDEGLTPGWGDVYTWDTPDQFIDISAVPPGVYDLVERTNPSSTILVSGAQQTCSLTQLSLTADAVTLLSTQASIPCPQG
jgi:hypothetical protein